jgi:hypothetical protein
MDLVPGSAMSLRSRHLEHQDLLFYLKINARLPNRKRVAASLEYGAFGRGPEGD